MAPVKTDGEAVRLQIPPHPRHVSLARLLAGAVAQRQGLDSEAVDDVRLLVSEACANAVNAQLAAGVGTPITLICRDDGVFFVEVLDAAGGFFDGAGLRLFPDVVAGEGADGGFGIPLMRHIADSVEFSRNPSGGTIVSLRVGPDRV